MGAGCCSGPQVRPYRDIDGSSLLGLLERECLGVVRDGYFAKCLADGTPLQDRANIPAEWFVAGADAKRRWQKYGAAFLVIISYSWLAKHHPDPECFHLKRLVRTLAEIKVFLQQETIPGRAGKLDEIGVIMDFCSLWQRHGDTETRSDAQIQQFKEGLKEINTPYAHSEVLAIKLMSVPPSVKRTYDDRGWTLFESLLINGKGSAETMHAIGGQGMDNILTFDDSFDPEVEPCHGYEFVVKFAHAQRLPPCTPERFQEEMMVREARAKAKGVDLFTNGKDHPFVLDKYAKAFEELLYADMFIFTRSQWQAAHVVQCAATVARCKDLRVLVISGVGVAVAEEIADALRPLARLETLDLSNNERSGVGIAKLSSSLRFLKRLKSLRLSENGIGDDALQSLAGVLHCVSKLESLELDRNDLSSTGAEFLANVLPRLKRLQRLNLTENRIGEQGRQLLRLRAPPALELMQLNDQSP